MTIQPIINKIKEKLTEKEIEKLLKSLDKDPTILMNGLSSTPDKSQEFINEVLLFVKKELKEPRGYSLSATHLIEEFMEFDEYAQKLATFSTKEIQNTLVKLLDYKNGCTISNQLLDCLEENLSIEDIIIVSSHKKLRKL